MRELRTSAAPHQLAWRLPAVLLAGLFMFMTAGLPAVAAGAARELLAENRHDVAGSVTLAVLDDVPGVTPDVAGPTSEPGLMARPPAGADTIPLDRCALRTWSDCHADSAGDGAEIRTNPHRGPPVTGQQ